MIVIPAPAIYIFNIIMQEKENTGASKKIDRYIDRKNNLTI